MKVLEQVRVGWLDAPFPTQRIQEDWVIDVEL